MCPQCGQPIAGVVTPPPVTVRAPVPDLSIPAAARADAPARISHGLWVLFLMTPVVVIAFWWATQHGRSPTRVTFGVDRDTVAKSMLEAAREGGVEYMTWQGDTLQVVMPRLPGDAQALADTVCNALRGQGVRGPARVAILERNAYLNGRREYMGEARCSL
jgi:hypothetical protein